jgi:hypothetical protein
MIFLITLGLMFGAFVVVRGMIKFRNANDVIEGANYELERAREERATISRRQLAGYYDGNSRWGHADNSVPRF